MARVSEQCRAIVWRMASAVLVQMNGLGWSLWAWMKAAISALSRSTLRCTPRLILLVGEQRKPAFDLVEPGGAGRGEVEVIARVAGEPRFDGRRFVGGVIVEHPDECRDWRARPARLAPGICGIRSPGGAGSSGR